MKNESIHLYVDSGYYIHIPGDRSKFFTWKTIEKGNVTFSNNAPSQIVGKRIVSMSNGRGKANNALFVGGMNHNLCSVSHMCDQAYDVIFNTNNCQIELASASEVVVEATITYNHIYVLKEKTERSHLLKIDENWLWHRRLGHLDFDQKVKLGKNNTIKYLQSY